LRRAAIIAADEVEAAARRHQPAGADFFAVADAEFVFLGHAERDPHHVRIGGVDLFDDRRFLVFGEIAVTAAHDLQPRIGFTQLFRASGVHRFGRAEKEEAQIVVARLLRCIVDEIGRRAALGDRRLGQKSGGDDDWLAVRMNEIGFGEISTEAFIVTRHRNGMAVGCEDQASLAPPAARGHAIAHHQAAHLLAADAGRSDAADDHFAIEAIGIAALIAAARLRDLVGKELLRAHQ
jgi:hypothetical protein